MKQITKVYRGIRRQLMKAIDDLADTDSLVKNDETKTLQLRAVRTTLLSAKDALNSILAD